MPERIDSTDGVLALLTSQHQQIEELFAAVARSSGKQRADHFYRLRRLLAVHETAEELVVHPRARWRLPDGDPVSTPRLQEEERLKQMLAVLEKLPVDSPEFTTGLDRLRAAVGDHAEAEEREEFPRLREELSAAALARMRVAARLAEAIAPTRPHPGAVFAIENAVIGTFTALLDRARDLISRPTEENTEKERPDGTERPDTGPGTDQAG